MVSAKDKVVRDSCGVALGRVVQLCALLSHVARGTVRHCRVAYRMSCAVFTPANNNILTTGQQTAVTNIKAIKYSRILNSFANISRELICHTETAQHGVSLSNLSSAGFKTESFVYLALCIVSEMQQDEWTKNSAIAEGPRDASCQ